MDEQLGYYVVNMAWQMGKLLDRVRGLTAEQMAWTPPRINNGIGRLIRHAADVMAFSDAGQAVATSLLLVALLFKTCGRKVLSTEDAGQPAVE